MKWWGCWLPTAAVLLLTVTGVDMEHLQAENLNILPPNKHNMVLNHGMAGIYLNFVSIFCLIFFFTHIVKNFFRFFF